MSFSIYVYFNFPYTWLLQGKEEIAQWKIMQKLRYYSNDNQKPRNIFQINSVQWLVKLKENGGFIVDYAPQ